MLLIYIGAVYLAFVLAYVTAKPELWVKTIFLLLDAVPNYFNYASEAMWTQFKGELALRFGV